MRKAWHEETSAAYKIQFLVEVLERKKYPWSPLVVVQNVLVGTGHVAADCFRITLSGIDFPVCCFRW